MLTFELLIGLAGIVGDLSFRILVDCFAVLVVLWLAGFGCFCLHALSFWFSVFGFPAMFGFVLLPWIAFWVLFADCVAWCCALFIVLGFT